MIIDIQKINQRLGDLRWTISDLAREMGVTPQNLYPKLSGKNSPTLSTVDKIAKALGVAPKDLLI